MKHKKGLALIVVASSALVAFQGATSPNGFVKPQCTWGADWNAEWSGWRLKFSANSGRDAWKWWTMVTNAGGKGATPQANSVLVFKKSSEGGPSSVGHVGWVKSVSGASLVLSHSNFPVNSGLRDETFDIRSDGRVRRRGYSTWYAVYGYLYKPSSAPPPPPPTAPEKLYVADEDLAAGEGQGGFFKHGPAQWWKRMTDAGRDGGMLYTLNNSPDLGITNMADWRPTIRTPQRYEVYVFVPRRNATTTCARYEIYSASGRRDVTVNQNAVSDGWVSLGTYPFSAGTSGLVRLIDVTSEKKYTRRIGFDAVKFEPRGVNP